MGCTSFDPWYRLVDQSESDHLEFGKEHSRANRVILTEFSRIFIMELIILTLQPESDHLEFGKEHTPTPIVSSQRTNDRCTRTSVVCSCTMYNCTCTSVVCSCTKCKCQYRSADVRVHLLFVRVQCIIVRVHLLFVRVQCTSVSTIPSMYAYICRLFVYSVQLYAYICCLFEYKVQMSVQIRGSVLSPCLSTPFHLPTVKIESVSLWWHRKKPRIAGLFPIQINNDY
jgi:hypothetical protein